MTSLAKLISNSKLFSFVSALKNRLSCPPTPNCSRKTIGFKLPSFLTFLHKKLNNIIQIYRLRLFFFYVGGYFNEVVCKFESLLYFYFNCVKKFYCDLDAFVIWLSRSIFLVFIEFWIYNKF